MLCECGCGAEVNAGKRYIRGHSSRGKHLSEETKWKIREALKGRRLSKVHRQKMSENHADISGVNNPFYGKCHTLKTKRKMSVVHKGMRHTEGSKQKMSDSFKGRQHSEETKRRLSRRMSGVNNPMYGKPAPEGTGRGKGSYCKKGHWVRSSWERAVADWLFDNGIGYEYEPERFVFNKRYSYLPDFYISSFDLYIEVKGWMKSSDKIKHKLFISRGYSLLVIGGVK